MAFECRKHKFRIALLWFLIVLFSIWAVPAFKEKRFARLKKASKYLNEINNKSNKLVKVYDVALPKKIGVSVRFYV